MYKYHTFQIENARYVIIMSWSLR